MRSALFTGLPAKHVPAHARPTRLPAAATTAGLTLSLLPAVLGTATGSASAATPVTAATSASAAAKGIRLPTHLAISELSRVVSGKTTVTTALVTKSQQMYFPRQRVNFQVFYARQWHTVAAGVTNSAGISRVAVPLVGGATWVRSYFPGQKTIVGNVSRSVHIGGPVRTLSLGQRAVAEARKHYGAAYRYGATGPSSFDCSGFSRYVYAKLGRALPHSSGAQERSVRAIPVSRKAIGDLIFTYTGGRVSHVGIYAGNNKMWAATHTGDIVRLQSLYSRNISVGRVA